MPSRRMHLAWKEALQKSSFSDLMLYQIKTILVTVALFWEIRKSYELTKLEKNTTKVHFNILHRKSYRTKKCKLLVFWYKYVGNYQTVVF